MGEEGVGTGIRDVATTNGSLCSAEIADKVIAKDGWYCIQELGDCV